MVHRSSSKLFMMVNGFAWERPTVIGVYWWLVLVNEGEHLLAAGDNPGVDGWYLGIGDSKIPTGWQVIAFCGVGDNFINVEELWIYGSKLGIRSNPQKWKSLVGGDTLLRDDNLTQPFDRWFEARCVWTIVASEPIWLCLDLMIHQQSLRQR